MDTSPEYIKMCEMAKEIQKGWHPNQGDFYTLGVKKDGTPAIYVLGCHWKECDGCKCEVEDCREDCTWLPRQDQLQKIVDNLKTTPSSMFLSISEWAEDPYGFGSMPFPKQQKQLRQWKKYINSLRTAEQLWLAFVMKEKFNKVWNGEDWEKVKAL